MLVQEKQAAAKQLDLAIRSTPWALTHNYIHNERETKGVQVEFAGPGDPTGRGRGFSFVRDIRRVRPCACLFVLPAKHVSCSVLKIVMVIHREYHFS